ncbi:unnamed protein product [Parajaminaea phylloscopi]
MRLDRLAQALVMQCPVTPSRHSLQGSSNLYSILWTESLSNARTCSSDTLSSCPAFPPLSDNLSLVNVTTPSRLHATGGLLGEAIVPPLTAIPIVKSRSLGALAPPGSSPQHEVNKPRPGVPISFSLPLGTSTSRTPSRRRVRTGSFVFESRARRTSSASASCKHTKPFCPSTSDAISVPRAGGGSDHTPDKAPSEGTDWLLTTPPSTPTPSNKSQDAKAPTLRHPSGQFLSTQRLLAAPIGPQRYNAPSLDYIQRLASSDDAPNPATISQRRLSFVRTDCGGDTVNPQSLELSRGSHSHGHTYPELSFDPQAPATRASPASILEWATQRCLSQQRQKRTASQARNEPQEPVQKEPLHCLDGDVASSLSAGEQDQPMSDPVSVCVAHQPVGAAKLPSVQPCTPLDGYSEEASETSLATQPVQRSSRALSTARSRRTRRARRSAHKKCSSVVAAPRETAELESGRRMTRSLARSFYQDTAKSAALSDTIVDLIKTPRVNVKNTSKADAVPAQCEPASPREEAPEKTVDLKTAPLCSDNTIPTEFRDTPTEVEVRRDKFPGFYQRYPISCHLPLGMRARVYDDSQGSLPPSLRSAAQRCQRRIRGDYNEEAEATNLYTPRFTRGSGLKKEGLCPICYDDPIGPREVWHRTKVSAYNYHLSVQHGINFATGLPFAPPLKFRTVDRKARSAHERSRMMQALCHSCRKWVDVESTKAVEVKVPELYFRKHAIRCHKAVALSGLGTPFIDNELYRRVMAAQPPSSSTMR